MRPRSLLSLFFLGISTLPLVAQVPPEKALSTFKVSEGLEISLFASEKEGFTNPTCFDIDHKGRVWVCESVNYRTKLHRKPLNRPSGDRIVILEDTKGEGKADKTTVFYQAPELYGPMGIAVAKDPVGPGYKVFVCQSPDILVFTDSKGEGKADGPPRKLLTGFQGFDHDHGVHGILIGPDRKLYFSVGDQGVHNLKSSDGKGKSWTSNNTDCRAGTIWRCDMDGKNLELIAHNFRNEYEPCVDSFGTVFVSDNDDDGNQQTRICYVMPGGNYGYHPRGQGQTHWHEEQPGVVPKILRTYFGSPTGMCVYEGTLLPKKYWGQLLHTDAGPRQVRCYHLKPNGAGYDVDREDMVSSSDNWFRPSDVCVAPDGSVFVADWYDPGVGGHGMGDITRGRIFRITPTGHKGYNVPKVDLESAKGVLTALGSPARSVSYMAMAKLREMKPTEAVELLTTATNKDSDPVLRARALWQIAAIAPLTTLAGTNFLPGFESAGADSTHFKLLCIRILRDLAGRRPDLDLVGHMNYWINNSEPAVRREILLTLKDAPAQAAKGPILDLASKYDGKDRFYLEAIGIAVGQDPERRKIILADFDKVFPEWNEKVLDLIWELRPPAAMAKLGERLSDPKTPANQRGRIVDILATSDDQDSGKALLTVLGQSGVSAEVREKAMANLRLFLPGKWQNLRASDDVMRAARGLMQQPETRGAGMQLIGAAARVDALADVAGVARDAKETDALRRVAIEVLGELPTDETAKVLGALTYMKPPSVPVDAVKSLGRLAGKRPNSPGTSFAMRILQDLVVATDRDSGLRVEAVSALTGTRPGTSWLLDLQAKGNLPKDVKNEAARMLRNTPYVDLRNRAMVAFPPPGKLDPKKLPNIGVLVKRTGDVTHGKQLFTASAKSDMQCMKCHSVRGSGGQIGPDLSMIGKKASRENLYESILFPSKAIADQYVTWVIEDKKGVTVSGLIVEDHPEHVWIRDANGKDTKILKKDIESREKSPKSLMPEDLLVYMSEDDLVDVVEYLFSLKNPVLALDYWHIAGPFDNGEGDKGLDEVFPPEKGIDLKARYDGKGGKISWQTVRPDAAGYVDLQAHFAGHSDQIVSYMYREIESPNDQEVTILLGTDDGGKLWVNGQLVFTSREHRAAAPEQNAVKVKLKKGLTTLLLKVNNGNGAHGFYLSIVSGEELKRVVKK